MSSSSSSSEWPFPATQQLQPLPRAQDLPRSQDLPRAQDPAFVESPRSKRIKVKHKLLEIDNIKFKELQKEDYNSREDMRT